MAVDAVKAAAAELHLSVNAFLLAKSRLTAFAQGRLDEAALAEVASHLGDWAECRARC